MSDQLFEVRVGEPWGRKAKVLLRSKLGLSQEVHGSKYDKVRRAKVLVFTGHHWVRHGGHPGEFRPSLSSSRGIDLSEIMRMRLGGMWLELISNTAKLIIVSGCYTLAKRSAEYFHTTFPNATLLGFAGSATLRKGNFFEKYLERLPDNLDVDNSDDVGTITKEWRKHIEAATGNKALWRGGSSDPTARKPGYMLPDGTIHYWVKTTKTWKQSSASII